MVVHALLLSFDKPLDTYKKLVRPWAISVNCSRSYHHVMLCSDCLLHTFVKNLNNFVHLLTTACFQ